MRARRCPLGRRGGVMPDCLFCKIVARSIPATLVDETTTLLAFRDINPQAPTHLLVIPKQHIASLAEIDASTAPLMGEATLFANRLAQQQGFADRGYRLVVNCGAEAGQTVWHLHLHLLGGRSFQWPPG